MRRGEKAIVNLFTKKIKYSHIYRWSPPEALQHFLLLHNQTDTAWTTGPCLAINRSGPLSEDLLYVQNTDGNVFVDVPGTRGHEKAPVVILQGHLDMVCEKTPESPHDFSRDPIRVVRDGDWLRSEGTTLGADNGIAVAACMAIMEDGSLVHGPLEFLFTIDEFI